MTKIHIQISPSALLSFSSWQEFINYPHEIVYFQEIATFCKDWLSGKNKFCLHTSGSTGIPKPIEIYRSQMQASAEATLNALAIEAQKMAFICLNTHYIAGKMMLVRSMVGDLGAYIVSPSSAPLENIDIQIDFAAFVPMQVHEIVKNEAQKNVFNRIKKVIIGGAALDIDLEQKLQNCQVACFHTYGMTETVSHIALRPINGEKKSTFFEVLPSVKIRKDERDCLAIHSPMNLSSWLQTNDIVKIHTPTQFEWIGRFDNVVNSGGIKIFPEKIELYIQDIFINLGLANRFVLIGKQDIALGEKLVLVVEGNMFSAEECLHILDVAKQKCPKHQAPKEILFVPKFPETETGKIKIGLVKNQI